MAGRELVFSEAVREFWHTRQGQDERQRLRGGSDQGARSAVTGGKQMDGFLRVITAQLHGAGVEPDEIFTQTKLELPGFYQTPNWCSSPRQASSAIRRSSHICPVSGPGACLSEFVSFQLSECLYVSAKIGYDRLQHFLAQDPPHLHRLPVCLLQRHFRG